MKKNQNIFHPVQKIGWGIFLVFFQFYSFAQNNPTVWLQTIPSKTEFSQSFNHYVFHDSEGLVWISSSAGLNRFDGKNVKLYEPLEKDSSSLFDPLVSGYFFENKDHDIWFSTNDAIHKWHRKTDKFSRFFVKKKSKDILEKEYQTIGFENNRYLWVSTLGGIYRYDTDEDVAKFIVKPDYFYRKYAKDTTRNVSMIFAFGGGRGLEFFSKKNNSETVHQSLKFENENIREVFYQNDSMVWVTSKQNPLRLWNPKTNQEKIIKAPIKGKPSIVALDSNTLILSDVEQGLFQYQIEENIFKSIEIRFLENNEKLTSGFWNIYIDPQQNLWISDMNNGVYFTSLKKNKFASIPKFKLPNNSSKYSFSKIIEDKDGIIWMGTQAAGVIKYDPRTNQFLNFIHQKNDKKSIPSDAVTDVFQDRKNRIWVATKHGLALHGKDNSFSIIKDKNGEGDYYFNSILELKSTGDLLLTFIDDSGKIFTVKEKGQKIWLEEIYEKEIDDDVCHYLFETRNGKILGSFFSEGVGVFKYQDGKLNLQSKIPINAHITSYWEDGLTESLWMATSNGLVRAYENDNYSTPEFLKTKGNLPGKYIKSILPEASNSIWLSTNNGLVKLDKDSLDIQTFGLADGMQSTDFHANAALKREGGDLWVGGFDGITIIPSNKIGSIKNIPKLKITSIRINDLIAEDLVCEKTGATNINQILHISRPIQDNTISISFNAIEYSDPNSNQLEYQLIGADKKPVRMEKGANGFARYPNLSFGKYVFRLRAANSDGVWGEQEDVLLITIRPPYYLTWQFILAMTLLGAGLIYLIYRYRIAQIQEKASLNFRIAENKMSALRSQMNPHFIYNSMQTVNGIILRKDTKGAMKYLNKFSKLMRMILENSREGKIPLEKEIEFLESYMEIEMRRFQNPFTYTIEVGEEVDTFNITIPSMLTQPFVENAIKHGIFHKKDSGNVSIQFLRENESLKCIIEDNGVGRAKTTELNAQRGRSHKSRGIEIVNERLEIIRQSYPGNYKVNIIDLVDLQQNPTGTMVEITLPI